MLRAVLFDPLMKALGNCGRLFLAPDGDLCLLPIEMLPEEDGSYLLDRYRISYVSTGRDLVRLQQRQGLPSGRARMSVIPDLKPAR